MDNQNKGNENTQDDINDFVDFYNDLLNTGHFKDKEDLFRFISWFENEILIILDEFV